ncbi:arginine utilization protein RocB [Mesorhizobium shonense]|uniref:Arginine utilization protein RocB n=1 Tax=Mesorhizobium shonense TaxID=1209948 RepID=A0ABV2I4Z1_9HYPH
MQVATNWNPGARVREPSCRLVGWGSETGSVGEAEFGDKLAGLLRGLPYFRRTPDHVRLVNSHGNPMTKMRRGAAGQRQSRTRHGWHYDFVSIKNYRGWPISHSIP